MVHPTRIQFCVAQDWSHMDVFRRGGACDGGTWVSGRMVRNEANGKLGGLVGTVGGVVGRTWGREAGEQ